MAVFAGVVVLVVAIIGAAWTSSFQRQCRIDPIGVDFGPLPELEGFWTPEFNLENLEKIHAEQGPEDVAGDSRGFLYKGQRMGGSSGSASMEMLRITPMLEDDLSAYLWLQGMNSTVRS
ncbi:unnamed protein product [Calypogeia fissa]